MSEQRAAEDMAARIAAMPEWRQLAEALTAAVAQDVAAIAQAHAQAHAQAVIRPRVRGIVVITIALLLALAAGATNGILLRQRKEAKEVTAWFSGLNTFLAVFGATFAFVFGATAWSGLGRRLGLIRPE